MNALLPLLAQCAVLLVSGSTVLLALGCGAVMLCKSPVHRQRISELTILGVLVWMVLALFPLPRLLPENWSAKPQAAEAQLPLELTPAPMHERAPIPTENEWRQELPITENVSEVPVGWPSQAVLETESEVLGSPSYVANESSTLSNEPSLDTSPSAEIAPIAPQIHSPENRSESVTTTASAWQFDSQKLAGLFTGAYFAGASLCLFWILAGYVLLLRIRQTAAAPPNWLANQYYELAQQAGIAPPRLIISRLCGRPLTWGMLWPVIVLPHSLCRQENKSQLRTILLHELGHIAQQDAQGNFLFCLALPLLYAHPLYWWLRRESQLAAELVADDWAAWQTGKETYVEELVALARCTGTSSLPLVGVTGLFSSPSQFYRRMSMLLAREKRLSTKTSLPWRLASLSALAGSVALAASLAGVRPAAGQTETPAVAPPAAAPADVENKPAPRTDAPEPELRVRANLRAGATKDDLLETNPNIPPSGTRPLGEPVEAVSPAEAALLAEIKQLQAKLRDLEAKRYTKVKPIEDSKVGTKERLVDQIKIIRADGQGFAVETWTTDKEGRPEKLLSISKQAVESREPVTEGTPNYREVIVPDLGRVLLPSGTKLGKPITFPGPPHVEYPIPTVKGTTRAPSIQNQPYSTESATTYGLPAGHSDPNLTKGGQQLDLISLATSYADAVSLREAAAAKLQDIEKLGDAKVISQQEITVAKLALSAAERKEKLLRSIAQVAMDSAAEEVQIAMSMRDAGRAPLSAAAEAKSRLAILKQILGTSEPAINPQKQP